MQTKLVLYIALPSVKLILDDISKLNMLVTTLKRLDFKKVYIENYRDGQLLHIDEVAKVRDALEKDFEVAGGLAIGTWGPGMGRNADWWKVCACIDDEKNLELFGRAIANQAKVFDEVLIDDFWANWCYSKEQVDVFNEMYGLSMKPEQLRTLTMFDSEIARLWAEYSKNLLASASRKLYSKAKEVNNRVKVILKVAEWREQYLHRGLDLKLLSHIFDGIYVGTESREGTIRYGSLFIIDYVRSFVGDKLRGAWFDSYNGLGIPTAITPEIFVEQLWYSFLGKVEEVTFFQGVEYVVNEKTLNNIESAPAVTESRGYHIELVEKSLPLLRRVEHMITEEKIGLISIPIQTPITSPVDSYIEDVLGCIGVPITSKPLNKIDKGDTVLIKSLIPKYLSLVDILKRGINVVLTAGVLEDIARGFLGRELLEVIGVDKDKPIVKDIIEAIAFTNNNVISSRSHRRPHLYPVGPIPNIRKDAVVHLYAIDRMGKRFPVLYEVKHDSASVIVAPVLRYSLSFLNQFPEVVRQTFRNVVAKFIGVAVDVERVSDINLNENSGISLVLYKSKSIAIVNENLHNKYFDIVILKNMLSITRFNKNVLGYAHVEDIDDSDEELRLRIRMLRHSFDILTFN